MVVTVGKVVNGKIEVEGDPLPEGRTVGVLVDDDGDAEGFELSADDEEELIDRIRNAEAGDVTSANEHLKKLRAKQ